MPLHEYNLQHGRMEWHGTLAEFETWINSLPWITALGHQHEMFQHVRRVLGTNGTYVNFRLGDKDRTFVRVYDEAYARKHTRDTIRNAILDALPPEEQAVTSPLSRLTIWTSFGGGAALHHVFSKPLDGESRDALKERHALLALAFEDGLRGRQPFRMLFDGEVGEHTIGDP